MYEQIYRVVRRIPEGRVATYGQVAELAGIPRQPRDRDERVPWQRVINVGGEVSDRSEPGAERVQRALLESEGVVFDQRGRVDLDRFRWKPRARSSRVSRRAGR